MPITRAGQAMEAAKDTAKMQAETLELLRAILREVTAIREALAEDRQA
jgi:hypothetical protein